MSLLNCYYEIKSILGDGIEPYESVCLVESYRDYWKPDNVKVVLLAESHVYTTDMNRRIRLPVNDMLPDYPDSYAKFVYCLAYGERQMTNDLKHPKRDGTPQFWKIFHSCMNPITCNEDFSLIQSRTPFPERLENKIRLLRQMRDQGVWLVDASIVALYDGGRKPSWNKMTEAIRASWDGYIMQKLKDANPVHIVCIGKGVGGILEDRLCSLVGANFEVLAQPNAHLPSRDHLANYKRYGDICRQICK